jgi:hypothetical protein
MNGTVARFLRLGGGLSGLLVLGWVLTGQAAQPAKHGIPLPTDWSHRHLIFTRPGSAEQLARVSRDPRYQQQLHRREQALALPARGADLSAFAPAILKKRGKQLKRDWSEDLGSGGSAGADNYPAKFSFDSTTANCGTATTPDYVVYSTGLAGSPGPLGQASVVGFDNLYSGCGGTIPSVYWAYNTAGQVLTSPVLSRDGSQIAFAQTNAGLLGTLVVLKWAAAPSDTVTSPETLVPLLTTSYLGCTAPCMTTIILRDHLGNATDDSTSSVYYDYTNDVAWVGGASGWLHKITGVFNGTPTEVNVAGGFPVQVLAGNDTLYSPVYDGVSNNVFVGDAAGFLYSVNATSAAVTKSAQLDFGTGLVDSPIVDSTNGFVYVFASSDGSANCPSAAPAVACSAVYQLSTGFTLNATGTEITAGTSVGFGTTPNPNPLYDGGFDSAYFSSVNGTGNLYVCGNTGANPILYQIPIVAGTPGTATAITTLTPGSSTAACSPVTDFYNPNTTGGPSERLFLSVQNNGSPSACSSGGCILNFVDTAWLPSTAYVLGQEILSPKLHIETVLTPGTSGATPPSWSNSAGVLKTDGSVVWIDQGALLAVTPGWVASHDYASPRDHILDSNGNIQIATIPGDSGTLAPSWNTTPGGTTPDGPDTLVWTNAGPVATVALSATGGTSGVIIDNTVNGAVAGSQIYFTTLADQTCPTSGGSGGCAVQASQPALQ